jgi:MurNAc alpha-1-phosphate uridylyltransferase
MQNNTPKTAMIFGAGLGKRMRPLTNKLPKPLVSVGGKPLIEYTLDKLRDFGINHVVVNTHYKAELLNEYLSSYRDLNITTLHEDQLLDTGGGLLQALPLLDTNPFFVINGDIIWQNNQTNLLENLSSSWNDNIKAILVLKEVKKAIGYDGNGDFFISESKEIKISTEKNKPYVFCGVQLLDPILLEEKELKPFSIVDIYKERLVGSCFSGVNALVHDGMWFHIGTPEGILLAEQYLQI